MNEENVNAERGGEHPATAERETAPSILKKFKDVDALVHAYEALQSEFTRRSQRLKQLEEERESKAKTQSSRACEGGEVPADEGKLQEELVRSQRLKQLEEERESKAKTQSSRACEGGEVPADEGNLQEELVRSQRLKQLEEERESKAKTQSSRACEGGEVPADEEGLYRAVSENEGLRARIVSEYLASLKGVPLMARGGVGVTAPAPKVKSIAEAGKLALGYFRGQNQS